MLWEGAAEAPDAWEQSGVLRARGDCGANAFDAVGLVASSKRRLLLRVHRHRLGREDLEDCYGQATLELLLAVRRGRVLHSQRHIANALEQRFLSRVQDRQRAIGGRSPIEAAMARAVRLSEGSGRVEDLVDPRADVEQLAQDRALLGATAQAAALLTSDQRVGLRSQLGIDLLTALELRQWDGWSSEKRRKVAQRGRARLRALVQHSAPDRVSRPVRETASAACETASAPVRETASRSCLRASGPVCARATDKRVGPTYEHPSPHI